MSTSALPVSPQSPQIAFVTYGAVPDIQADDVPAGRVLEQSGVAPVPWSSDGVDWRRFEAVVMRSAWDYHIAPDRFRVWLDLMEKNRVLLWNPAALMRWNM